MKWETPIINFNDHFFVCLTTFFFFQNFKMEKFRKSKIIITFSSVQKVKLRLFFGDLFGNTRLWEAKYVIYIKFVLLEKKLKTHPFGCFFWEFLKNYYYSSLYRFQTSYQKKLKMVRQLNIKYRVTPRLRIVFFFAFIPSFFSFVYHGNFQKNIIIIQKVGNTKCFFFQLDFE